MKKFFEKHQRKLLWIANHWFSKWILGLNRLPKPIKYKRIDRICPASIHWKTGRIFKKKRQWYEEWKSAFFTRPRFAEALVFNFGWLFELFHYWDLVFGKRILALNLGFDDFDPTESYYSGAGDGNVYRVITDTTWSNARNTADGTGVNYTGTNGNMAYSNFASPYYHVARGFFPVDTSALPDNAIISSATFYIYALSDKAYVDNASFCLIQTSQASPSSLAVGDYDALTLDSPSEGASRIAISGITIGAYFSLSLNSTGIGWISKTSWTLLGTRNSLDIDNTTPTGDNGITCATSEYAGTTSDPYLSVTYTVPAGKSQGYIF